MTLTIPLGKVGSMASGGVLSRTSRAAIEKRMLRAIIGGVAIADPAKAVQKQNSKKGELFAATIKDAELGKLFDAIETVDDDPESAPKATTLDTTIARVLGTKAADVAAVRKIASSDTGARDAGLAWAASLDVALLAKAGNHANTEVQLKRIPTVEKKQIALEQQVEDLRKDFKGLKAELDKLKPKSSASAARSRSD